MVFKGQHIIANIVLTNHEFHGRKDFMMVLKKLFFCDVSRDILLMEDILHHPYETLQTMGHLPYQLVSRISEPSTV